MPSRLCDSNLQRQTDIVDNRNRNNVHCMVLKSDGNSEIGAHIRINLSYLICLRHLIKSRSVTNRIFFFSKKPIFLIYFELPFRISDWVFTIYFFYDQFYYLYF